MVSHNPDEIFNRFLIWALRLLLDFRVCSFEAVMRESAPAPRFFRGPPLGEPLGEGTAKPDKSRTFGFLRNPAPNPELELGSRDCCFCSFEVMKESAPGPGFRVRDCCFCLLRCERSAPGPGFRASSLRW
eukprot:UN21908